SRHRSDRTRDHRQSLVLSPTRPRWPQPSPGSAPGTSSSNPTAHGRTARSNASTGPWPSSGPTGTSSPATPNGQTPLPPGSSSTTLDADAPHSTASHPSAACNQPHGRVQLAGAGPPDDQLGLDQPAHRRPGVPGDPLEQRSEERRVGKQGRGASGP